MKILSVITTLGAAAALVGCGATAPTVEEIAAPKAAIEAAEELGAKELPVASLHLKLAQEQYTVAQRLIDEDENERATLVLERALANAELAREMARTDATRKAAEVAEQELRSLRAQ